MPENAGNIPMISSTDPANSVDLGDFAKTARTQTSGLDKVVYKAMKPDLASTRECRRRRGDRKTEGQSTCPQRFRELMWRLNDPVYKIVARYSKVEFKVARWPLCASSDGKAWDEAKVLSPCVRS